MREGNSDTHTHTHTHTHTDKVVKVVKRASKLSNEGTFLGKDCVWSGGQSPGQRVLVTPGLLGGMKEHATFK